MAEKQPKKLDINAKQKTTYAVPMALHDLQIKRNIELVKERVTPGAVRRTEPIAVVAFGPSLQETWEEIKRFEYVITCSGAHKFLVGKGIIPTYHLDVDPRSHKIGLMGEPQPLTEYLLASTCSPKYVQYLLERKAIVKLWHIFDNQDEAHRVLPRGEWALTGGCSAGLRCMTMARFLGFTELHIFGMDGCAKGKSHAGDHPLGPRKFATCEFDGVTYETTPSILEAARQTLKELDAMPDVSWKFYGEGLVQAMAKKHIRQPVKGDALIAFNPPELISVAHREANAQMHRDNLAYGIGGDRHAPVVTKLVDQLGLKSVLDYGCGKGMLANALPFPIWEYDPAVPGKDTPPLPAELVVCGDVLEHVEPDKLLFVLDDLRRCVKRVGYFVIHTGPAKKKLPDGRNTHLIQQGKEWWGKVLEDYFEVGQITEKGPHLHVVVGRKTKTKPTKDPAAKGEIVSDGKGKEAPLATV